MFGSTPMLSAKDIVNMYALIYERYPGNTIVLEYGSIEECKMYKALLDKDLANETEIVMAWKDEDGNIDW